MLTLDSLKPASHRSPMVDDSLSIVIQGGTNLKEI